MWLVYRLLLPHMPHVTFFLFCATNSNSSYRQWIRHSIIAVASANWVFFLFSDYRGYKARKDVSKLKTIAAKMETKRVYFLQQVRILINVFENASCSKQNSLFWWIFFSFYKEHFTVNVLCYWGMFLLYLKLIEYGYNRKLFWNEKSMTLLWVLIKWGASFNDFQLAIARVE